MAARSHADGPERVCQGWCRPRIRYASRRRNHPIPCLDAKSSHQSASHPMFEWVLPRQWLLGPPARRSRGRGGRLGISCTDFISQTDEQKPAANTKARPEGRALFVLKEGLAFDQAHAFQFEQHLMRAVVDFDILGLNAQFGVCGHVIRV